MHRSLFTVQCLPILLVEGEIDTEQFMEEIRKYDCLFNRFRKEFKEKLKKLNAWSKFYFFMLSGTAITLLHSEEVHHFKELIQKTGCEKIPKYKIKEDELQSMVDKYQETLKQLQDAVKLEGQKKSQNKGKQQIMKLLQEQLMKNLSQN